MVYLIKKAGRLWLVLVINLFIILLSACEQKGGKQFPSPAGYDMNKPTLVKLPATLDEISGLSYYKKDKAVFSICDDKGILFKIFPDENNPVIEKWKFRDGGDYEDLVLKDSFFYVMTSKGKIIKFSFHGKDIADTSEYKIGLEGKNEFESLYDDTKRDRLIMICKNCAEDTSVVTSVYAFNTKTNVFETHPFSIDAAIVEKYVPLKKNKLRPSAAAIHPVTHELYIVSSVNKVLVVADENGVIKKVYPLDPKLFKQPEGIAFNENGDMMISNESADVGASNILVFKYQTSKR